MRLRYRRRMGFLLRKSVEVIGESTCGNELIGRRTITFRLDIDDGRFGVATIAQMSAPGRYPSEEFVLPRVLRSAASPGFRGIGWRRNGNWSGLLVPPFRAGRLFD